MSVIDRAWTCINRWKRRGYDGQSAIFEEIMKMVSQWQPIETAPKDGTFILVAVPGDVKTHIMLVWWVNGWCLDMTDTPIVGTPTHWMPLPEPPK